MTESTLVEAVVKAIAAGTGFEKQTRRGLPEPVSRRLHNPGLLTKWMRTPGDPYPTVGGHVDFPDDKTGWSALHAFVVIQVLKRRSSINGILYRQSSRWQVEGGPIAMEASLTAAVASLKQAGINIDPEEPLVSVL